MSLTSTSNRADFGVTAATNFPFSFKVFAASDVVVTRVDSTGVETTVSPSLYTVNGVGNDSGSIDYPTHAATDLSLTILRVVDETQPTVLRNQGNFYADVVEKAFDRVVMISQQHRDELNRRFYVSPGSLVDTKMPTPTPLGLLRWNSVGSALENTLSGPAYASTTVSASSYGSDISAAITAIGSAAVTLVVDSPITVNNNATFNDNTSIVVQKPGLLTIAVGKVLTIPGTLYAPPRQIFAGAGTVAITGEVWAEWWGFSTSASAAANTTALGLAMDNDRIVNVGSGLFPLNGFTFKGKSRLGLTGHGRTRFQLAAGTSIIFGGAGHVGGTDDVRRMVMQNIEVSAAGATTYGIQLLWCVDCDFVNVRVEDGVNIATAWKLDFSWDNLFQHCITYTSACAWELTGSNVNENTWVAGRFESSAIATAVGVKLYGRANKFFGCDISSWKYGFVVGDVRGCLIQGCYYEALTGCGIIFSTTTLGIVSGACYGLDIRGNMFDMAPTVGGTAVNAIKIYAGVNDLPAVGVIIQGNTFSNFTFPIVLADDNSINWIVGGNKFNDGSSTVAVTKAVSGNGLQCQIDDGSSFQYDHKREYRKSLGSVSGTVTLDSVANLLGSGTQSYVTVQGISSDSTAFEALAIITAEGVLQYNSLVYNTAGIGAIQISGGNLQVTTLGAAIWEIFIEVRQRVS